ncbi:hypothetical protein ROHU_010379 [Labeo rohita]|uniref:Uncharacterized protein n=1 Tax=Labeo rohita TaxID=84645 RepID=A0A498M2F8_LABRO|nr:hypothetical protein ROHU_010379 [Labeo rohita]
MGGKPDIRPLPLSKRGVSERDGPRATDRQTAAADALGCRRADGTRPNLPGGSSWSRKHAQVCRSHALNLQHINHCSRRRVKYWNRKQYLHDVNADIADASSAAHASAASDWTGRGGPSVRMRGSGRRVLRGHWPAVLYAGNTLRSFGTVSGAAAEGRVINYVTPPHTSLRSRLILAYLRTRPYRAYLETLAAAGSITAYRRTTDRRLRR